MRKIKAQLRKCKYHRKKIDMVVLKITPSGQLGKQSKPCANCIQSLISTKIGNVYYIDIDPLSRYFISQNGNNSTFVMSKFHELLNDDNKHITRSYRNNIINRLQSNNRRTTQKNKKQNL